MNQRHDVAHNRFKIQRPQVRDSPFLTNSRTRRMTSPARLIVFHDVLKDGADLSEIRRVGSKETLRGLGVAEDRRERLIQFMRQTTPRVRPS